VAQVTFTVPGIPAPQGSKTRTKWGVREDNPATRPWRAAVGWEASLVMQGREQLAGPLALEVVFFFPRPKSHYGTGKRAAVLKDSAPDFHTSPPDADKLLRAIGDSVKGIICRDDSLFAIVRAEKVYGSPRAIVLVREIADGHDAPSTLA
jgi:Holliday junction resolvase RusA-like endonuclease